jgi:hypothetical protein
MKPPLAGRNRVGIQLQILLFPRLRAPEDRPITLGVYLCSECTELWIPSILSVPWQKFTAASLRRHAKLGHQKCVALFRYSYPCMSAGSLALLSSLSYPLLKPLLCSYDVVISGIYMNTDTCSFFFQPRNSSHLTQEEPGEEAECTFKAASTVLQQWVHSAPTDDLAHIESGNCTKVQVKARLDSFCYQACLNVGQVSGIPW